LSGSCPSAARRAPARAPWRRRRPSLRNGIGAPGGGRQAPRRKKGRSSGRTAWSLGGRGRLGPSEAPDGGRNRAPTENRRAVCSPRRRARRSVSSRPGSKLVRITVAVFAHRKLETNDGVRSAEQSLLLLRDEGVRDRLVETEARGFSQHRSLEAPRRRGGCGRNRRKHRRDGIEAPHARHLFDEVCFHGDIGSMRGAFHGKRGRSVVVLRGGGRPARAVAAYRLPRRTGRARREVRRAARTEAHARQRERRSPYDDRAPHHLTRSERPRSGPWPRPSAAGKPAQSNAPLEAVARLRRQRVVPRRAPDPPRLEIGAFHDHAAGRRADFALSVRPSLRRARTAPRHRR